MVTDKSVARRRQKAGVLRKAGRRAGMLGEVLGFFWARKLWWLLPMVVLLLGLSVLIVVAQATPFGPFIYALF
jgi:hypothetical protein